MYRFTLNDSQFLPHLGCEVEFVIKRGELICMVGENGLGKTSLLQRFFYENNLLVSMIQQKSLEFFYDRQLFKIKEILYESSSQQISRDKFDDYWKIFKLDQKENRYLSSLSGGEAQALKLCLGLSISRDIYFLDEPSQFLDETSKSKLSEIIQTLILELKSVFIIEHDFNWIKLPMTVCQLEIKNNILIRGRTWIT